MSCRENRLTLSELAGIHPLGLPLISLIIGILLGYKGAEWLSVAVFLIIASVCILVLLILKKSSATAVLRLRNLFLFPVVFGFVGMGVASWLLFSPPSGLSEEGQFATAKISDIASNMSGDMLTADILCFDEPDGRRIALNSPVKILIFTDATELRRGDVIRFRNFAEPVDRRSSYGKFLYSKGIGWTQNVPAQRMVLLGYSPGVAEYFSDIRDYIAIWMDRTALQDQTKGFLEALLLGERDRISQTTWREFASAGVAHLLALSGMHLAMVVMILSFILIPFSAVLDRRLRFLLLIIGIWLFVLLTGLSVSVTRAAIMTSVCLFSVILQRKHTGTNALFLAGLLMLLFDPVALFSVSFQLSFLTCAALLFFSEKINSIIQGGHEKRYMLVRSAWADEHPRLLKLRLLGERWGRKLAAACAVSVVAFSTSWILTAYWFHEISLVFLPANLMAMVLVTGIFLIAAIYLPLTAAGLAIPFLGNSLDALCRWLSELCTRLSDTSLGGHHLVVSTPAVMFYICALLLLALWLTTKKRKWFVMACVTLAATFLMAVGLPVRMPERGLVIKNVKGEPSVEYMRGDESSRLKFPKGEVSYLTTPVGDVVMADCDGVLKTDLKECRLLVVGKDCCRGVPHLIEQVNPKEIAFDGWDYRRDKEDLIRMLEEKNIPLRKIATERVFLKY